MTDRGSKGYGPFHRQQPWAPWWIWLWGAVAVGLLTSVWFRVPFMYWAVAALVLFGTMEGYGLSTSNDAYPPLTQVIREYIPRWLAFALIFFSVGGAGGTWFHFRNRVGLAVLTGLVGWLIAHFDVTFDSAAVVQENTKYSWYAEVLHRPRIRDWLIAKRPSTDRPT